jgi:PAP2 superfamily
MFATLPLRLFQAPAAIALASALVLGHAAHAADDHRSRSRQTASWCGDRCDALVIDWNANAYQVIKATDNYADPLAASRALAMMHLAMHDAANAARPRYATYATTEQDAGADAAIAAVTAAHDVLAALYPSQRTPLLKAMLDQSMVEAGIGEDVAKGTALGKRAAANILARRAEDGANRKQGYREGTRPGEYRFTPGFELSSPSQFRVAPPPALNSAEYVTAFNEVKRVGSDRTDARRSPDETQYAAFWYEFSDIGWNRIARVVAREHQQDLWERARLFALLNVAMADAYIAGWDSKLHYNFWRPVTAIRLAETDGNPRTQGDATFNPLLRTPPIQDHPSTHSALGAAAAAVLAATFGDEVKFSFASTSAVAANPVRTFRSFSEAARENADSRVKAGLHFRFATVEGLKLGENIGRFAVSTSLQRID